MANTSAMHSRWTPDPIYFPLPSAQGPPAIQVDLRKQYGDIEAVAGLDFELFEGEIFGLLGPNGAGKTTTISMLATRLLPTAGDAQVFGHSVRTDIHQVRRLLGLVPQEIALYPKLTACRERALLRPRLRRAPRRSARARRRDARAGWTGRPAAMIWSRPIPVA